MHNFLWLRPQIRFDGIAGISSPFFERRILPISSMKKSTVLALMAGMALPASAASYSNNFDAYADGTTDLGDGTQMNGASASVQGGRLQITIDGQALGFASFNIPGLPDSSKGWTASFDYEMFDGPGNNVPADGFSFNYGNFGLGTLGSAEEGMAGDGAVTNNLSFEVDTWMNFDAEQGVNIGVKIGGTQLGDPAFTNGPILNDGTGVSGSMLISWDPVNGASFSTTGLLTNADFTNADTGAFAGDDGFLFGFSGRVGGANQDLFIDNLVITTVPEPSSAALLGLGAFGLLLRRRR